MSNLLIFLLCGLSSALGYGVPGPMKDNKVVLYESLCPGCRIDMTKSVAPVYHELSAFLDIHLYPYGNAQMNNLDNGTTVISCQHGPDECYGNTIHVCAIDILKDPVVYVAYIACMMNGKSTDSDATQCASNMKIDVNPILRCAKSSKGHMLLVEAGKQTQQFHLHYVPYTLLNGQLMDYNKDLKTEICKLLSNPPPACK